MASDDTPTMSEETYDYICTSCAEDDLIKEALKYCVDCQRYCCQDCLTSHKRIPLLRDHAFLDNSAVKPQGQPRSLPAFPTQQCSKHAGMIMYMYCGDHDDVCCYICAAEDHRSCKDMVPVSDNLDRLYCKSNTSKATTDLNELVDEMFARRTNTDMLPQRLRDSKATAIKAVVNFRIEMEAFLKKLEEASIKEIEHEYTELESQLLEERKRYDNYIEDLKNLIQLMGKASGNKAQLFVCTKVAENKLTAIRSEGMNRGKINNAEVNFLPSEELKSSIETAMRLGKSSAISSRQYSVYEATKGNGINVKLNDDSKVCQILGSCIVDDTVIFTDNTNKKLKRFDVLSSSLIDYCKIPVGSNGVCRVGLKAVAVACEDVIQFVSINDKLSLSHSIKMKHKSYGIAHNDDKLYITNEGKSLYMYDMSGSLLKTVSNDRYGQYLFGRSNHITISDKVDRLFVGDDMKGLVCFNTRCEYIETVKDPDIRPDGVCTDGYGNIIVANLELCTIVQCNKDGQKRRKIVNKTQQNPRCVCIHHRRRKMFVGYNDSNTVEVFDMTFTDV